VDTTDCAGPANGHFYVNSYPSKRPAFDDPSHVYLLTLLHRADVIRFPVDQCLGTARAWHELVLNGGSSPTEKWASSPANILTALQMVSKRDSRWWLLWRWASSKRWWSKRVRKRQVDDIEALANAPATLDDLLANLVDARAA
jgi:hypothetical protein